jgi:hypothetical protein
MEGEVVNTVILKASDDCKESLLMDWDTTICTCCSSCVVMLDVTLLSRLHEGNKSNNFKRLRIGLQYRHAWFLWFKSIKGTRLMGKVFILFILCIVIRAHTTLTNKYTLIITCYVIQYSHSELARHVSIRCWDHHQALLDYNLHNYKLTIKVRIKIIKCIKVKIVGYLCWFLGPLEINVKNIKLNMDINVHTHSKLSECYHCNLRFTIKSLYTFV